MSMQYNKQDYCTASCTADKNKYLYKHNIETNNLVYKEKKTHFVIIYPNGRITQFMIWPLLFSDSVGRLCMISVSLTGIVLTIT